MTKASATIQMMRHQQLTRGMRAAAILRFFTLVFSLSRIWYVGWHNLYQAEIKLLFRGCAFANRSSE